ncbi:MAG: hypothetical protein C4291_14515 [Candidatus Dadabacteria bacterium]
MAEDKAELIETIVRSANTRYVALLFVKDSVLKVQGNGTKAYFGVQGVHFVYDEAEKKLLVWLPGNTIPMVFEDCSFYEVLE